MKKIINRKLYDTDTAEAKDFIADYGDVETYEKLFGEVEE